VVAAKFRQRLEALAQEGELTAEETVELSALLIPQEAR
jgi:hypothetical protein